ncbi:component of SufBCD complex [Litorivita pollutaquae]|uniref:Component of SufBCD complex n=1 Tax=Litorivita pollutaquae TaxID=2200892 RepID=A0A2V4MPH5_9RHOB|nr:component of SufBCD complex [Litorivita pollutaquae]OUS22627.1 component of SufBCD complex [Rhodobacterales bacterium 59_46_T64]PYC48631.1 component of SufBCD complex [Litorivita pollutaquae]
MDLHQTVFELIDMRSFSNLWYWIALAVVWSSASHYVLGVPWDLAMRARRKGGDALSDFESMVRINVNRILYISEVSGLLITGFAFFVMTTLALLAFVYANEFAQAVFLLAFPVSIVGLLSVYTARAIDRRALTGHDLYRRLHLHRIATQAIGMVAIFVTALFGMLQNLNLGAL